MNITEFNEIYMSLLKRRPTDGDIKAHIHKNRDKFILEVLNCNEFRLLHLVPKVNVIPPVSVSIAKKPIMNKNSVNTRNRTVYSNIQIRKCNCNK